MHFISQSEHPGDSPFEIYEAEMAIPPRVPETKPCRRFGGSAAAVSPGWVRWEVVPLADGQSVLRTLRSRNARVLRDERCDVRGVSCRARRTALYNVCANHKRGRDLR